MKKVLVIALIALAQLAAVSMASADELGDGWHGAVGVSLAGQGGSASITESCGFIGIKDWHADGKPMQGESSSALPGPNRVETPVTVTAKVLENGDLDINIDGTNYRLAPGYEPSVICG